MFICKWHSYCTLIWSCLSPTHCTITPVGCQVVKILTSRQEFWVKVHLPVFKALLSSRFLSVIKILLSSYLVDIVRPVYINYHSSGWAAGKSIFGLNLGTMLLLLLSQYDQSFSMDYSFSSKPTSYALSAPYLHTYVCP